MREKTILFRDLYDENINCKVIDLKSSSKIYFILSRSTGFSEIPSCDATPLPVDE